MAAEIRRRADVVLGLDLNPVTGCFAARGINGPLAHPVAPMPREVAHG